MAFQITFSQHSSKFPLREGDNLKLTCSGSGHPAPISLTLSRLRTTEVLDTVHSADSDTQLTHTIPSLHCLDTGVYVCSGRNSQGSAAERTLVGVHCKWQDVKFSPYEGFNGKTNPTDVTLFEKQTVKLKFEDSPYDWCEIFGLQCSFCCQLFFYIF